jgi:hypothetical protein
MIGGDEIIEPHDRDARWFFYRVGIYEADEKRIIVIRSLKKLTGKQLLAKAQLRMKPYKPRPKK